MPARELAHDRVRPGPEVGDGQRPVDRRRSLGPWHPVQPREHAQDLAAGQFDVEVVELGHDPHGHACRLGFAGQCEAEDLDRALVGQGLRGEHPHGGRFAGAVGAQQAEADAGRNDQVKAGHGFHGTEALANVVELDRCSRVGHAGAAPPLPPPRHCRCRTRRAS